MAICELAFFAFLILIHEVPLAALLASLETRTETAIADLALLANP